MDAREDILRRLEELESRAAFHDELGERLNDVVARQDREILKLESRVGDLARRLGELIAGEPPEAPDPAGSDEIPPHY